MFSRVNYYFIIIFSIIKNDSGSFSRFNRLEYYEIPFPCLRLSLSPGAYLLYLLYLSCVPIKCLFILYMFIHMFCTLYSQCLSRIYTGRLMDSVIVIKHNKIVDIVTNIGRSRVIQFCRICLNFLVNRLVTNYNRWFVIFTSCPLYFIVFFFVRHWHFQKFNRNSFCYI